jgi:hypothetical protein
MASLLMVIVGYYMLYSTTGDYSIMKFFWIFYVIIS